MLFHPYQKEWVDQRKKPDMSKLLIVFANKYFGSLLAALPSQAQRQEFLSVLMSVVHSHRHNKKEETAIVRRPIDFDVVRDTMYKYSKKAQQKFFADVQLSFLFLWFLDSPASDDLLQEKFGDKGQDYLARMRQEL